MTGNPEEKSKVKKSTEFNLGQKQTLAVVKTVDFGVYLGNVDEKVLLPKKQVPQGTKVGDRIEVFIYRDSEDRLIATTNEPKLTMGQIAVLEVKDVGSMGAFLDWGLEKDLFLPFREQTDKVEKGDRALVSLYIDKSERLCATMKVYHLLRTDSHYRKDDRVRGIVYDKSGQFGFFVAVDGIYSALIPKKDVTAPLRVGMEVEARVAEVKPDGKLNLSLTDKIPQQMEKDAEYILEELKKNNGVLPITDKSSPEEIRERLKMSKSAFKRAAGRLFKAEKIEILEDCIKIR